MNIKSLLPKRTKYPRLNLIKWGGIVSLILASWSIFVYEFHWPIGMPFPYFYGWNKFALGLAYGVITGSIIYFLTVYLPLYKRKKKNRVRLYSWLASSYHEFCTIPSQIKNPSLSSQKHIIRIPIQGQAMILSPSCVECILNNCDWYTTINILNTRISVLEAIKYYITEMQEKAETILNIYSDILSEREIDCLNALLTTQLTAILHFLTEDDHKDSVVKPDNKEATSDRNTRLQQIDSPNISPNINSGEIKLFLTNLLWVCNSLNKEYFGNTELH